MIGIALSRSFHVDPHSLDLADVGTLSRVWRLGELIPNGLFLKTGLRRPELVAFGVSVALKSPF